MTKVYGRSGGLAVLAAAAIGLAACGGSSSPHVASLGNSSGTTPGPTTTLPKGNPTQLLDEWASCMRANGTPGVADPTIDANGVIHITLPATGTDQGGSGKVSSGGGPGGGPCGAYLTAASTALRGGQPLQKPDPAKVLKYSECMRANGIPDFPDPSGHGLQIQIRPGSDLDPNNPTFKNASKLCAKKTGVPGLGGAGPQRGGIEEQTGNGPAGGPGGNGGAGAGSGAVIGSGGGASSGSGK
jgi:hypothetical protein